MKASTWLERLVAGKQFCGSKVLQISLTISQAELLDVRASGPQNKLNSQDVGVSGALGNKSRLSVQKRVWSFTRKCMSLVEGQA